MPNQHTGEQYTREDCIEALQKATKELGHSPKMDEYRSLDIHPGTWTIIDRFDSWNKAKEKANLEIYLKRLEVPDILDMSKDEWDSLDRSRRSSLVKWEKVVEYKMDNGCNKCGYNEHPSALEFHHKDKDTKDFTIGSNYHAYSIEDIMKEIEKCEVLCSNCHAIEESNYNISI